MNLLKKAAYNYQICAQEKYQTPGGQQWRIIKSSIQHFNKYIDKTVSSILQSNSM